jgi:hypothetical protein
LTAPASPSRRRAATSYAWAASASSLNLAVRGRRGGRDARPRVTPWVAAPMPRRALRARPRSWAAGQARRGHPGTGAEAHTAARAHLPTWCWCDLSVTRTRQALVPLSYVRPTKRWSQLAGGAAPGRSNGVTSVDRRAARPTTGGMWRWPEAPALVSRGWGGGKTGRGPPARGANRNARARTLPHPHTQNDACSRIDGPGPGRAGG